MFTAAWAHICTGIHTAIITSNQLPMKSTPNHFFSVLRSRVKRLNITY